MKIIPIITNHEGLYYINLYKKYGMRFSDIPRGYRPIVKGLGLCITNVAFCASFITTLMIVTLLVNR